MSLVEAVGFHSMFSFKYSQRPNTLAARRMPDTVPDAEKTARLMALQSRQKTIQARLHAGCVGQSVDVLVDSRSRRQTDAEMFSGRTTQNTVVNFPGRPEWLGSMLKVRVDSAGPYSLRGEVVGQRRTRCKSK
jgi:tRNA-2-methylthio-N6-dimethylallyladenosine synthase